MEKFGLEAVRCGFCVIVLKKNKNCLKNLFLRARQQ